MRGVLAGGIGGGGDVDVDVDVYVDVDDYVDAAARGTRRRMATGG
jgi:hypothetical protein